MPNSSATDVPSAAPIDRPLRSPVFWGDPLRLLPLFGFFAIMSVVQAKSPQDGDGWRYLLNARHILDGYFAGPDTLMFWNGPGYPLFLVPFVGLGLPMALARLANAVFLFLAVAHFQGALRLAGIGKRSLAYAYALGILLFLHGPLLGMIMTESISVYLVCGAAWHAGAAARGGEGSLRHTLLTGLHLGYLALTKVFFGYVLEACLVLTIGAWVWMKLRSGGKRVTGPEVHGDRENGRADGKRGVGAEDEGDTGSGLEPAMLASRTAAWACAAGLLLCVPWLGHTWAKTGKANLWGNSGGFQLYYMSLPEKEYFGDWINFEALLENPEYFRPLVGFIRETLKLDWVAQDAVFKREAIKNCREHPGKCVLNWRANVNRMVFGYPNTRYPGAEADLSTGNRAFIFAFPFILCLLFTVPGWLGRRSVPPWVHACLAFALLSLGGMSLVCAIPRQVFPMLPLLGLWMAVVAEKAMKIRGRWN